MQGWWRADGSGFMDVGGQRGTGERLGPPTIADVAAHAGVGVATVSRVLNGHPNVADPTRERVLERSASSNYRPSSVARNLSLRRTLVIGVVVPFFTYPSAVERLRGIVSALEASPVRPGALRRRVGRPPASRLRPARARRPRRRAARRLARPARGRARSPRGGADSRACSSTRLTRRCRPSCPTTSTAAMLATRHLLELGHRRSHSSATSRRTASASIRAAIEPRATCGSSRGRGSRCVPTTCAKGRRAVMWRGASRRTCCVFPSPRRRSSPRPTRRRSACSRRRRPSACASRTSSPSSASTTSRSPPTWSHHRRQPLFESGRRGAELLLQALAGEPLVGRSETLPLELVVRATTGAARPHLRLASPRRPAPCRPRTAAVQVVPSAGMLSSRRVSSQPGSPRWRSRRAARRPARSRRGAAGGGRSFRPPRPAAWTPSGRRSDVERRCARSRRRPPAAGSRRTMPPRASTT